MTSIVDGWPLVLATHLVHAQVFVHLVNGWLINVTYFLSLFFLDAQLHIIFVLRIKRHHLAVVLLGVLGVLTGFILFLRLEAIETISKSSAKPCQAVIILVLLP